MRLSDASVARLRPREHEYTVWDTRVAGLGVRVRPSGAATFVVLRRVEGRSRRCALGAVGSESVEAMRRRCHALMAESESRTGPARTPEAPLFRDFVCGAWQAAHYPRYKPSTRRSYDAALVNQLLPAFGSTPLPRITREQVLRWFDAYSRTAPGGANFAFQLLRQILNFAHHCGHIDTTPAREIRANRRTALTRFLSREELRRLHAALDNHARRGAGHRQQADIIRLLLLTGCRKSEILHLRWSEVRPHALALRDAKTGPRSVALNTPARRILERQPRGQSAFVFPSPLRPERPRARDVALWYAVRRDAGIEDLRLHDLRHTLASHAVMSGVPVPVVARLLGHANVRMTLRYAHLSDGAIEAVAERVGAAMARTMGLGPQLHPLGSSSGGSSV